MFVDHIQQEIHQRVELGYAQNIVVVYLSEDARQVFHAGTFSSLSDDTVFEVGSITKVLTAHLAVILEKEGLLNLDSPIQSYLPEVSFPTYSKEMPITLRHLLTHTSGLKDPEEENDYNKKNGNTVPVADYTLEDVGAYLRQTQLAFAPGTQIRYSNLGYGIVGCVLEKVSKKDYFSLLREQILIPLSMNQTYLWGKGNQGMEAGRTVPSWEIPYLPAFGALKSTAKDLTAYLRCYLNNSLDADLLEKMLTPYLEWDRDSIDAALGWTIDRRYGGRFYAATGQTLGFSSFMGFDPIKKVGIILLTNASQLDHLGHSFLNPLFPISTLYKAISLSKEALQKFSGKYRMRSDDDETILTVEAEDGFLSLYTDSGHTLFMYPLNETRFFARFLFSTPQWLRFELDALTGAMSLLLQDEGRGVEQIFYRQEPTDF